MQNDIIVSFVGMSSNNEGGWKVLTDRGIRPEEHPPAEDIKKLERRVKAEEKKLPKQIPKLAAGKKGK